MKTHWHRLSEITREGQVIELMAATSDDGIGVIARWTLRKDGSYEVWAMDTETCEWESIQCEREGEIVPLNPPTEFNDKTP